MPLNASQIQEHMKVVNADGQPFGTVDRVEGNRIKLTKGAGDQHRYVDLDEVDGVRDGEVCLTTGAKPQMH